MGKVFTIADGLENLGALRTGGQGSVYKGKRSGPIISAVKILPTPIHNEGEDDKNYLNFINEVEKLKKVNEIPNPNVVKILSSGISESGSLPFIEMEYIEGPDLEELLNPPHDAIFTIKEVLKLAEQLAAALSHCHSVGVKHGDVKSNNVKFNIHSGNYVLLDFGLSVMSDEQRRSSLRHAGAIEFMAPEQNEGRMLFQTDIYSYGVILYELLTGEVPFPLTDNGETSRNAVMISHMESPVPDLLELRRQKLPESWPATRQEREMLVPNWLLLMVSRCLEKLPENRFSNGRDLHETLVANSISPSYDETAVDAITALKTENGKLQATLLQYQARERKSSISIPVYLFGAIVVLLIASIIGWAYPVFSIKKNVAVPARDTVAKVIPFTKKKDTSPKVKKTAVLPDTAKSVAKNDLGINIPNYDSIRKAQAAPPVKKKKHHKKPKKFLGIF